MTTNPLVEFLASYGPQASANNMYDEFVAAAAERMNCQPILIEQPQVEKLTKELGSDSARSVILTGTAGDGKTYTARKILERLSGGKKSWGTTDKVLDYEYNGRRIRFIKDLSELNDAHKDELFPDVCTSLAGGDGDVFVICVNDGHLLKFFRDRRDREHGEELHREISERLQRGNEPSSEDAFQLINMSRLDYTDLVNEIIDAVVKHPDWKGCEGCPALNDSDHPCPIRTNVNLLGAKGDPSLRERLQDMIRMASSDGRHLSIRQLLLLTVNIVLGERRGSKGAVLLNCKSAKRRAKNADYQFTNPYANAFGDNLKESQRLQYGAFAVLGEFGVGRETNNYFDQGLVSGEAQLPDDPVYGERIFSSHRERYQADSVDGLESFFAAIIDQRRRLFFSVAANDEEVHKDPRRNPWNLTVYKHGASHCRLADHGGVASKQELRDIRREIILGLNRMMSGYLTRTNDRLWIIEPSGVYRGREIPLVVEQAGQKNQGSVVLRFESPEDKGAPPRIEIDVGKEVDSVPLKLRPSLTECLIRVAHGALPSSFSSECRQEIERFQLAMVAALEPSSGERPAPNLLGMEQGELQEHVIAVLSDQGEW